MLTLIIQNYHLIPVCYQIIKLLLNLTSFQFKPVLIKLQLFTSAHLLFRYQTKPQIIILY